MTLCKVCQHLPVYRETKYNQKSLLYSVYLVLENEELTTTIITDAETLV